MGRSVRPAQNVSPNAQVLRPDYVGRSFGDGVATPARGEAEQRVMPDFDRYESRLVAQIVAIELGASQESVGLRWPMFALHIGVQALEPRSRCLSPATRTSLHVSFRLVARLSASSRTQPARQTHPGHQPRPARVQRTFQRGFRNIFDSLGQLGLEPPERRLHRGGALPRYFQPSAPLLYPVRGKQIIAQVL